MKKTIMLGIVLLVLMSLSVLSASPTYTYADQYIDEGSPTNDFDGVGYHEVQSNDGVGGNGVGIWSFDLTGETFNQANFSFFKDGVGEGGAGDNRDYGLYYCDTSYTEGGMTHTVWSSVDRFCDIVPFGILEWDDVSGSPGLQRYSFDLPINAINDPDQIFTIIINATTRGGQQYFYLHEREDGDSTAGVIQFSILVGGPAVPTTEIKTELVVNENQETYFNLTFLNYNLTSASRVGLNYNGTYYPTQITRFNESFVIFNISLIPEIVLLNDTVNTYFWNYTLRYTNGSSEHTGDLSSFNQNVLWNLSVYPRYNITAIDFISGTPITSFDIFNDDLLKIGATAWGESYFYGSGEQQLFFNNSNYVLTAVNLTFNANNFSSYTFLLYTLNSVNITFLDEVTEEVVNKNVSVEFVSDLISYNFTAYNGKLYADLLSPTNYVIRYVADAYGTIREYYFTLTDQSHTNLNLYMINDTDGTEVTFTVYDQLTANPIEGAVVYLQKFFIDDNTYKTVAEYTTDSSGKAYFSVEADNEYYKALVDFPLGTNKYISDKFYISATNYNIYISLISDAGNKFFEKESITGFVNYNSATETFTATWNDGASVSTGFCFYLKTYGQYMMETNNVSCSVANSGSAELKGIQSDKTNYAVLYAYIDGEEVAIASNSQEIYTDQLDTGTFGLFMTVILVILFSFILSFHRVALVMGSGALVFSKLLGLLSIGWEYVFGIVAVAIVINLVIEVFGKR
jgi:hypothetical protein